MENSIIIEGAKEHNLKNISLKIPRHSLVVITGVSGSGKSSLAFDTILAESQRRFFSTLSQYTQQFMESKQRPHVDKISGLSPAIHLAQQETRPSSRATLASQTDLGELFGTLFSKYGSTYCPKHNLPTSPLSTDQIIEQLLQTRTDQTCILTFPIAKQKTGTFAKELSRYSEYGRILHNGQVKNLPLQEKLDGKKKHDIEVIVDVFKITSKNSQRLWSSLELAFSEGQGVAQVYDVDRDWVISQPQMFNQKSGCPKCQYSFADLDSRYFSPNSLGRCEKCQGKPPGCDACQQTRLNSNLGFIRIAKTSWLDLVSLDIQRVLDIINTFQASKVGFQVLQHEIQERLQQILQAGLGHLNLFRSIDSLSGGELQRLRLCNILNENLKGILYILDEPSQGLHLSEVSQLADRLRQLCRQGNTVLLVDHDIELIKKCDLVIDLGPGGGKHGGNLLAMFSPENAEKYQNISFTASAMVQSEIPRNTSNLGGEHIHLISPSLHNLKNETITFKKGQLNIICGVSGSGKTSLLKCLDEAATCSHPNWSQGLEPAQPFQLCHTIDRTPLGKNAFSTPGSWLGAFPFIRDLYASLPEAKIYGVASKDLSLISKTGYRCSNCQGKGFETLSMKFLKDSHILCQSCQGHRFQPPARDLKWNGYTLPDVMQMDLSTVVEVFKNHPKITRKIQPAVDLGMGYLTFGQPTHSLSGGEAQRLKLSPLFSAKQHTETIALIDEPTQGLHSRDISKLSLCLRKLTDLGMTIVMIEHDPNMILQADHIVELGPESGDQGGYPLYQGPLHRFKNTATSRLINESFV